VGGDGGSLLTLVASAGAAGIQLTRYQPEAGGGVSVVLQGQDFNAILNWLAGMERQEQVRVRQLSIDAHGEPGRVNARISYKISLLRR
jgi:type II secretory pathway component PulM